jgi:Icc-related predicted phosphoesterase
LNSRYGDVDLVISCGDLSYLYLEFIISQLNKPLFFVYGNHDPLEEISEGEPRPYPFGAENLHRRINRDQGFLLAGVEGSIRYNRKTPYQYTQGRMWNHVLSLVPGLLLNKLIYGRYLDVFVTHAPPKGIHEGSDFTHQGINAFLWLIKVFQPSYHFHGHIIRA